MPNPACPRCAEPARPNDNFCSQCGWSLHLADEDTDGDALNGPVTAAAEFLPAVRSDLAPLIAPFAPAIRRTATLLAAAAATDWAVRRAAPALAGTALRKLARPAERAILDETITIRHTVTTRS